MTKSIYISFWYVSNGHTSLKNHRNSKRKRKAQKHKNINEFLEESPKPKNIET